MAQQVKHNPTAIPPSSPQLVYDPSIDLVAQQAGHARIERAAADPAPLVGDEPVKFDFRANITAAYGQQRVQNFERAKTLFLEILEQAKSPDCPAEFATYSLYYVNCLVGLAETWKAPGESFAYAKQVLHQIDHILGKEIVKPETYQTLLRYVKRVENFVSSDPTYRANCSHLIKVLEEKCAEKNPVKAPPPAAAPENPLKAPHAQPAAPKEARKVTPTDPSKGSSTTYRIFFLFVGLLLAAGVATLYRRYIVQISPPSK